MAKQIRSGRGLRRTDLLEIVILFRATINENDETSELNSTESAMPKGGIKPYKFEIFSEKDCLKLLKTIELFPYDREDEGSCLINSSIVLGLRIIGKGFSAGKKLCAPRFAPFLSKLAFRNQKENC
ncbi:hypothetical protein TNCV_3723101 [Trichonephila clavipes]|nr:hypothetical protein TNCV_3723101 [Trichonephila clavipes]